MTIKIERNAEGYTALIQNSYGHNYYLLFSKEDLLELKKLLNEMDI